MGKIIFFDRNDIQTNETAEVLCQLELVDEIVVARGDRFILRRPSPTETIGGGSVIDPHATRHRFGPATVEALQIKQAGTPIERISSYIEDVSIATRTDIIKFAAISAHEFQEVEDALQQIDATLYTVKPVYHHVQSQLITRLESFHEQFPMRSGMNKAELVSTVSESYPVPLVEHALASLHDTEQISIHEQLVATWEFTPHLPPEWAHKLLAVEETLANQSLEVGKWDKLFTHKKVRSDIQKEFYYFLIQTNRAHVFDDERLVSAQAVTEVLYQLEQGTNRENFNLQKAREILNISRKNLVPFLELLDQLGHTEREGNERRWI